MRWKRPEGCYADEAVEQFLHTEVIQGRTEENRGHLGIQVGLHVEFGIDTIHQFQVLAQLSGILFAHEIIQGRAINVHLHLLRHALLVGGEEVQILLVDVKDALERGTLVDRPGKRPHLNLEFLLQLIELVEGVLALAVHLIDEDDDGRLPHAADGHKLTRLRLHTLGAVHHDDGAIHSCKGAERILGKVLVTRRVEYVHLVTLVVELHDGGGDGYTALFLYLHPVAGSRFLNLVALNCTSHLNLSAKEQELLGEGGLTGIWVRDDGKGSSSFYFLVHIYEGSKFIVPVIFSQEFQQVGYRCKGLLRLGRELASLHLKECGAIYGIEAVLYLVLLACSTTGPQLYDEGQGLVVCRAVERLLGVAQQFLVTVGEQGNRIAHDLNMPGLLYTLLAHHAYERLVPLALLTKLVVGELEPRQILLADAVDIECIGPDYILHLEHIYHISCDILSTKFLCNKHSPIPLLYIYSKNKPAPSQLLS